MPTVNGITFHNKLGVCGTVTGHYMQTTTATACKDLTPYGQRCKTRYQTDPTRYPTINMGGCVASPKYGQTGDYRYGTLEFIDWYMTRLRDLGVGWYREWGAVPAMQYDLESQNVNQPVVCSDDNDWSALDLIVQRCEEYGIQFVLTIPWPWSYGWGSCFTWISQGPINLTNVLDNWLVPITLFLADRYKDKHAFIQIDPANEHGTSGMNIGQSAIIQNTLYDAVKSAAPSMRCNLTSCEWSNYDALLSGVDHSKFDGHWKTHCYPVADQVHDTYGYHYWPVTEATNMAAKLDAIGRSDVNIRIDEFWPSGWVNPGVYDIGYANPFTQYSIDVRKYVIDKFLEQSVSLSRLDGMCMWRLLAARRDGGAAQGFNTGASWEGTLIGITPSFPPSDYESTLYDHVLSKGLYDGVLTTHNRNEAVVYAKNTTLALGDTPDSPSPSTAIYYGWDTPEPVTEYTGPITMQRGTLYWRGADSNGNLEPINSAAFMVEGTYTVDGKESTTKDINGNQVTSGRIGQ